ncbi:MAG: hypothetical protein ACK40Q_02540 [Pseudothermotoga sp.]
MRKTITLLTILFAFITLANPILDLVENLAGVRDIFIEFELIMRVKNQEQIQESSIGGDLAIRNLEDFYFLIKKPSIISQLTFDYISSTKRLYSSFPGYLDMENVQLSVINFMEILQSILKIMQTPVVITQIEGDTVTISPTTLIAGRSAEPVVFKMRIREGLIEELTITNKSEDEYIKVKINKFSLNPNVDVYFHFER